MMRKWHGGSIQERVHVMGLQASPFPLSCPSLGSSKAVGSAVQIRQIMVSGDLETVSGLRCSKLTNLRYI